MTDEQKAQRGKDAQAVLDNPAYRDAYAQIESRLVDTWKAARTPEDREECHQLLRVLEKVHGVLDAAMQAGRLADDVMRRKRTFADKLLKRSA